MLAFYSIYLVGFFLKILVGFTAVSDVIWFNLSSFDPGKKPETPILLLNHIDRTVKLIIMLNSVVMNQYKLNA